MEHNFKVTLTKSKKGRTAKLKIIVPTKFSQEIINTAKKNFEVEFLITGRVINKLEQTTITFDLLDENTVETVSNGMVRMFRKMSKLDNICLN